MLSGGMAQRVLVATALGVGAPVIIADEPTKGLDADRVSQAIVALKRLAAAGRSLFVITHDRASPRSSTAVSRSSARDGSSNRGRVRPS